MSSPHLGPKVDLIQTIKSNKSESEYSAKIVGQTVNVVCSSETHDRSSSKVKLTNRSDYNWEFKYYYGSLVAAHLSGKIIAYAMKGKDGGMVRVSNLECDKRAIIKNLKDDIKDVSFSYSRTDIVLGIVDCEGNILVYRIHDHPQAITYTLLLHVFHHEITSRSKVNYRLIWCPYLQSGDDSTESSDDPEKMFVVLNGPQAQVYNVTILSQKYPVQTVYPDDNYEGYINIEHSDDIIDAAFSPDGTAIAIASTNGFVKFFQLYMVDSEKQKCLHEWRPHEGKPLSSINFIDNVLEYSSECWKFTITGANHNSEIKLWSCETWTCLQTFNFNVDPTCRILNVFLNISIDHTGQYLVMSDVNNRILYVLQLERNDKEQIVHVTTLSQFLLPNTFLSFHILEAQKRTIPFSFNNSNDDLYDDDEDRDDFEEEDLETVSLRMLVIQPKKFQECNIAFKPDLLYSNTITQLTDETVASDHEVEKLPKLNDLQSSVTLLIQQQQSSMTLMTPENFTANNSRPSSELIVNDKSSGDDEPAVESILEFQRPQKDTFASGGSSPSREVQEILSLNNSTYSTQDYFDNLAKIKDDADIEPQIEDEEAMSMIYSNAMADEQWENDKIAVKASDEQSDLNKSHLEGLNFRLNSLENTIREQNIMMQKLQQEFSVEKKLDFAAELDNAMSKQYIQIAKMLESWMTVQKTNERTLQEQIVAGVGQLLSKSLNEKLQVIISQEYKHVVVPAIRTMVDNYRQQVDKQNVQRLGNIDIMLRENINKAFNSKMLIDSLSHSVVNIVGPSLENCYRDIIVSTLIPSWEKICGNMFQQINDTFTKGTKEYTVCVENYMDRQRRVQDKGKDLITQMHAISEGMKLNSDNLTVTLTTEINKQFNTVFKGLQDKLTSNVKEVINEQVKQGFKNHAAVLEDSVINAVRSRAVSPSPHVDSQLTLNSIQMNLNKGHYDEAFQLALSAENLAFVIYVCESVDSNVIFGTDCLLQQSCLLALIQQLSMELHKHTDLKITFIRSAFLALLPDHPNTKQFVQKVLFELLKQLNSFIQANPPMAQLTQAKVLKMAVDSMFNQKSGRIN